MTIAIIIIIFVMIMIISIIIGVIFLLLFHQHEQISERRHEHLFGNSRRRQERDGRSGAGIVFQSDDASFSRFGHEEGAGMDRPGIVAVIGRKGGKPIQRQGRGAHIGGRRTTLSLSTTSTLFHTIVPTTGMIQVQRPSNRNGTAAPFPPPNAIVARGRKQQVPSSQVVVVPPHAGTNIVVVVGIIRQSIRIRIRMIRRMIRLRVDDRHDRSGGDCGGRCWAERRRHSKQLRQSNATILCRIVIVLVVVVAAGNPIRHCRSSSRSSRSSIRRELEHVRRHERPPRGDKIRQGRSKGDAPQPTAVGGNHLDHPAAAVDPGGRW